MKAVEIMAQSLPSNSGSFVADSFSEFAMKLVSAVETAIGEGATVAQVKDVVADRNKLEELCNSVSDNEQKLTLEGFLVYDEDYYSKVVAMPVHVLSQHS